VLHVFAGVLLASLLPGCSENKLIAASEDTGSSRLDRGPVPHGDDDSDGPGNDGPIVDDPDAAPPVAIASGPSRVEVGDTLELDGAGSYDPQGYAITRYDWSCSDGTTATGPTPEVRFAAEATVNCALVVRSETGLTDRDAVDVRVLSELAEWTFMVFLNGDNNLEDYALRDMNEMESVGSTDEVNMVVQLDRSTGYDTSEGNWTGARRYRVEADGDRGRIGSPVLEDLGWSDSGDWQTVVDFAGWAIDRYPARRYALVIWNHGWGWYLTEGAPEKGVSSDDGTGNSISIANGDYERLLEHITNRAEGRLELVGMDACIMQSWEVAHVTAPYARTYVASQDYESADGWDYAGAMRDLVADPEMSGIGLGESIAYWFWHSGDSTQSVVDLDALSSLDAALDDFADAAINSGEARSLLEVAGSAQDFEGGWGTDHDLGDYLSRLETRTSGDVHAAVVAARSAYGRAVTSNYTRGDWVRDATGLSIYTPTYGGVDWSYKQASWSSETRWDDFLMAGTGGW
jgi:hypothetical protein